jgi:membrane fusion protein (multidrug efflux system)
MSTSASAIGAEQEVPRPAAEAKAARPSRTAIVMGTIALVGAVAGTGWYVTHRGLETTDDAQVDSDVVSVPTRASGLVIKVDFTDNQVVKAGELLAELDAEPAKARLAQADANLLAAQASAEAADADARVAETNARGNKSAAEAGLTGAESSAVASKQQIAEGEAQVASAGTNLSRVKLDLERAQSLVASGSVAQAQLDQAQAAFDTAKAVLDQAHARLASLKASTGQAVSKIQEANARVQITSNVDALIEQARSRARTAHAQVAVSQATRELAALELSYTRIMAPQDGLVSKKTVAVGQMVAPGQGIVQLVPVHDLWITGNFKETQIHKMRVGQPAHVEIDAFPGVALHGEVESFSAATGARFTLLPPDNASGNYTKVVQRVPVRIRLKEIPAGITLRPGMSVDVSVDTNK